MANEKSVFATLNAINCNDHTERKNGLTYLSWAWAWAKVKEQYPTAFYTIYENADGLFYHTDFNTCWVKTGVTIEGIEHIEYLPVMDYRNASIPKAKVTSFDVNKAIQRSLTKACARHGLGLYIYAGEDLPEAEQTATAPAQTRAKAQTKSELKAVALLAMDYLAGNATALSYYNNKHNKRTLDEYDDELLAAIYEQLKANGKL